MTMSTKERFCSRLSLTIYKVSLITLSHIVEFTAKTYFDCLLRHRGSFDHREIAYTLLSLPEWLRTCEPQPSALYVGVVVAMLVNYFAIMTVLTRPILPIWIL